MKMSFVASCVTLFFCCLLLRPDTAAAEHFRYQTNGDEPITQILEAFALFRMQSCDLSEALQKGDGGTLDGTFDFDKPAKFFDFFERNKDIVNYSNGSSLYFSLRSEMDSALFSMRGMSVAGLRSRLRDLGLYDGRYPFQSAGNTLFRLTAPQPYMAAVTQIVDDISAEAEERRRQKATRVFRLRHAWADDITVTFMDKEVTVPGVATLLRNITGGTPASEVTPRSRSAAQPLTSLTEPTKPTRTGAQSPEKQERQPTDGNDAPGARILADPRLNAVIVWDDAERMSFYEHLVQELDQAIALVEIRVAIIEVDVNKTQELGISWSGSSGMKDGVPQDGMSVIGGANAGTNAAMLSPVGAGLNLTTVYKHGMDYLMSRVVAMEGKGDANVLSRPAVLTMDNVQASLENTSTFYVQVAGREVAQLYDVTYGTVLRVTPHIMEEPGGGKLIKLVVHVESGSSSATGMDATLTNLPVVSKNIINTQAMIAENQALIIGGYYYEKKSTTINGIPVLMDVPMLGRLFRKDTDGVQKTERLFVIAPRVVDPRDMTALPPPHIMEALQVSTQLTPPVQLEGSGCTRKRVVHP